MAREINLEEFREGLFNIMGAKAASKSAYAGYILVYLETIPVFESRRRQYQLNLFTSLIQNFGTVKPSGREVTIIPEFVLSNYQYETKIKKWGDFLSLIVQEIYEQRPPLPVAAQKLWDCLQKIEPQVDRAVMLSDLLFYSGLTPYYPPCEIFIAPEQVESLQDQLQIEFQSISTLTNGGIYTSPLEEDLHILEVILGRKDRVERALLLGFAKQAFATFVYSRIEELKMKEATLPKITEITLETLKKILAKIGDEQQEEEGTENTEDENTEDEK